MFATRCKCGLRSSSIHHLTAHAVKYIIEIQGQAPACRATKLEAVMAVRARLPPKARLYRAKWNDALYLYTTAAQAEMDDGSNAFAVIRENNDDSGVGC